jgi:ADP-L-glycero-D-manno-heptose 6-epimerase
MSAERDAHRDDLIVVTGGAGFIGSHIVTDLAEAGARVVVADLLRSGDKWRNFATALLHDLVRPEALFDWLGRDGDKVTAIVHMGAISSTTESDIDKLVAANVRLTLDLWQWCTSNRTRLIYASSAATYGDGAAGFVDDDSPAALAALRPLNAYGWSKHLVDRRVVDDVVRGRPAPPQWAGLKLFNVYGANEIHKGEMQSLVSKIYPVIKAGGAVSLFRSHHPDYADGGQLRDFVYVKDCTAVMLWLAGHAQVSGLFNLGTGQARSFVDLVHAIGAALDRPVRIEFVPIPESIRANYQYFTEAKMTKLRDAGYTQAFYSLEEGVADYVRQYLVRPDIYR